MNSINLSELSLLALVTCLAVSCSNSDTSQSTLVNGYYLSSETLFVTHDDPRFQDSTFTINYSLSEGENILISTDVTDGDLNRDRITSFDNNGRLLMQIYAGPSTNLLSDDPYDIRYSNTYNDGLLTRIDFETFYLLYEYQNNVVVKREVHNFDFDSLQMESRFIYDSDNHLESITSYAKAQPGTEPEWLALDRCLYVNDSGLRSARQCERFSTIDNGWVTRSTATYEYDEAGNLIVLVDTLFSADGGTQTLSFVSEYLPTERAVPNLGLFQLDYLEGP